MAKHRLWISVGVLWVFLILAFSATAAADKPINLRLSSFVPPGHFMNTRILQPWIEMIDKDTNGKVKIKIYPGSALGKPQDQYDMAVSGVADIT